MRNKFASLTLTALLSAIGTTSALAHEDYTDTGIFHWVSDVAKSGGQPAERQIGTPYGYAVTGGAGRVVNIDANTRYLNVVRLETVQINVGGKSVIWMFDTLGSRSFPLDKIVPGAANVTVYVDENPNYRG